MSVDGEGESLPSAASGAPAAPRSAGGTAKELVELLQVLEKRVVLPQPMKTVLEMHKQGSVDPVLFQEAIAQVRQLMGVG